MDLHALLGDDADDLLNHTSKGIAKEDLHLPGPDFIDRCLAPTDRSPVVLRNLASMYDHGRLAGTGYVSILPVDQGIEHSAAASFAPNPIYFDPANICRLAVEGGCNAVASTFGVLGALSREYAHKIPFIVKLNHNELLTYPNKFDQIMFGSVEGGLRPRRGRRRGHDLLRLGRVDAARSRRCREAFKRGPRPRACSRCCGATCATAPSRPTRPTSTPSADLTGQANHIGVTIEADIIKQKLPENNGGYNAFSGYGKTSKLVYERADDRPPDRPLPLAGGQLLHGPHRAHQLRRRVEGRRRPGRRGAHRGDQQARRRPGPHLRAQGVPAPDGRGRRAAATPSRTSTWTAPSPSPDPRRLAARGRSSVTPTRRHRRCRGGTATRCACTRSVAGRPRWARVTIGAGVGRRAGVLRLTWARVYVR